MVISLEGSSHADAIFIAKQANRRKFVADLQYIIIDHFLKTIGYLHIQVIIGSKTIFTHSVKKSDIVKNTKTESVFYNYFVPYLCSDSGKCDERHETKTR